MVHWQPVKRGGRKNNVEKDRRAQSEISLHPSSWSTCCRLTRTAEVSKAGKRSQKKKGKKVRTVLGRRKEKASP